MRMKAVRSGMRMRLLGPDLIRRCAHCRSPVSLLCHCCSMEMPPSDFRLRWPKQPADRHAHTTTTNSRRSVRTSSSSGSSSALLCSSRSSTSTRACALLLCHALATVEFVLIQLAGLSSGWMGDGCRQKARLDGHGRGQGWAQYDSGTKGR